MTGFYWIYENTHQAGGLIINIRDFKKSVNPDSLTTDFLLYRVIFLRTQFRVYP